MTKGRLVMLSVVLGLLGVGCQNEAPIAEGQVRNKDGEVEGKEPKFVLVPAQNDPNNPNRR